MFENFTDRARRVISYAIKEAQLVGADFVATEHLLLGLHKEPTGLAAHALRECKADESATRAVLDKLMPKGVPASAPSPLPFTPQARQALEQSIAEARRFGHPYIGTEHILLGLLKDSESAVAEVLKVLEVAPQAIVVVLYDLLGFDPSAYPEAKKVEEPTPAAAALNAARTEKSKTLGELKEPKNRAYLTAVVLVQRLKEAGMTWDETVGLAVVLRQMTEAEANKLMYQALMGDVGEQGAKPA